MLNGKFEVLSNMNGIDKGREIKFEEGEGVVIMNGITLTYYDVEDLEDLRKTYKMIVKPLVSREQKRANEIQKIIDDYKIEIEIYEKNIRKILLNIKFHEIELKKILREL